MDLLEDITRGLRGDDEQTQTDQSRASEPKADRWSADGERADEETEQDSSDERHERESVAEDDERESAGENETAKSEDGRHVCSFCQAEFDADRRACPECDAEIVLRGRR